MYLIYTYLTLACVHPDPLLPQRDLPRVDRQEPQCAHSLVRERHTRPADGALRYTQRCHTRSRVSLITNTYEFPL